ncbi:RNA polymerase sigma factor [Haliangium sp.]|uniref:RNA polymerase sigma factor n=1 Tax=Haliangium sp. TaxID=2663208 RepID=UPI003D144311
MDSDLDLLEQWRSGDQRAGNELFQRHFDSIYRFFDNKVHGDIDELVQSTFLACVRSRDQFRGQSSFRTYLFTVARHELYRYLRRRRRDGERLDFGVTSIEDLGHSVRSQMAKNQTHERLLAALRTLPVDLQVLLELFYWEGMGNAELAEVLDVAPATVRTRLYRARQVLRERLEALANEPAPVRTSIEDLDAWASAMRARHDTSEP